MVSIKLIWGMSVDMSGHADPAKSPSAQTTSRSFWWVVLEKWVPAIITAVVGGLAIAYLAPAFQTQQTATTALTERRQNLWEAVVRDTSGYILNYKRLNEAARYKIRLQEKNKEPEPNLSERMETYRMNRDGFRKKLKANLTLAAHYFGPAVKSTVKTYEEFHEKYKTATIDELPQDHEVEAHLDKIIDAIRKDLESRTKIF